MTTFKNVKDFMSERLITIDPKASATDAAKLMRENKINSLIVKSGEVYFGVLTEKDICQKVVALERVPSETPVEDIMTHDILTVESRSTMRSAFLEMNKRKIRHIAVTENGRYVGILSVKDFANYYSSRILRQKRN